MGCRHTTSELRFPHITGSSATSVKATSKITTEPHQSTGKELDEKRKWASNDRLIAISCKYRSPYHKRFTKGTDLFALNLGPVRPEACGIAVRLGAVHVRKLIMLPPLLIPRRCGLSTLHRRGSADLLPRLDGVASHFSFQPTFRPPPFAFFAPAAAA
jgi:hypothetical protein